MLCERIEKLRQEYTGQRVTVDASRPELARFADAPAVVKTVNFNGRALIQFDGADRSWHDVGLDYLKVIDTIDEPQAEAAENESAATEPEKPTLAAMGKAGLSRLELARMEKKGSSD